MQAKTIEGSHSNISANLKLSVLVPTYRRPADLRRCLEALTKQCRPPDTVTVVCRDDDRETHDVLSSTTMIAPLSVVYVSAPGLIAALNAGLASLTGDIVAITDDDAAPRADWLELIEEHFLRYPEIGGLGGRDHVHGGSPQAEANVVGVIQWFGRQIGNHHVGMGAPRYVDMLKGVNMSFRLAAIGSDRFDGRLRGSGAQVHNELGLCLAIQRKGWRLMYDPAVAVDHYPAIRFDEDQRSQKSLLATSNSAYNETLILLEYLPLFVRPIFLLWALLIGARDLPGIAQCARLAIKGEPVWAQLPAVIGGRIAAVRASNFWLRPARVMANLVRTLG